MSATSADCVGVGVGVGVWVCGWDRVCVCAGGRVLAAGHLHESTVTSLFPLLRVTCCAGPSINLLVCLVGALVAVLSGTTCALACTATSGASATRRCTIMRCPALSPPRPRPRPHPHPLTLTFTLTLTLTLTHPCTQPNVHASPIPCPNVPILFHCVPAGQEYISEVVDQLLYLADNSFTTFPLMKKLVFFRETRHAFGRTALMLSGGEDPVFL